MKSITSDSEEYDLDVQGAIAILEYAARQYCKELDGDIRHLYTRKEILDSIALLKEVVNEDLYDVRMIYHNGSFDVVRSFDNKHDAHAFAQESEESDTYRNSITEFDVVKK